MYRVDPQTNDIIIDGWESGISDSPYGTNLQTQVGNIQQTGLSDMRNVNVISIPGEASVIFQTAQAHQTAITAAAYTATASNDTFTYSGTALKNGTAIVITVTTGTAGITTGNTYWVQNATPTTFKVGSGVSGAGTPTAVVDVTSDGTGTFTTVNLGSLVQMISALDPAFVGTGIDGSFLQEGRMFGVDTNGLAWVFVPATPNWVYLGNTGNASPPGSNGIAFFHGYIFVFLAGGDNKTIYAADTSTTTWHTANLTGVTKYTSSTSARTFIDSDGLLYWCNGSNIGYIVAVGAFDPTNNATYTASDTLLTIPPYDVTNCMEQLGQNMLIGASKNIIYVWDRNVLDNTNTGATTSPIEIPEAGVTRIVAVNSNAYFFAGNRGRIYITNGANVSLYKKIPDHLSGTVEPYYQWGGAVYSRNQLYFSVSCLNAATSAAIPNYGGIWAVSTDTNAMRLVNQMSYGTYAGFVSELAQFITNTNQVAGVVFGQVSVISGWYDGVSVYGSDYVPTSPTPYSSGQAYVDSDMIPVGTLLKPMTDNNIEYKLTVPMVANEYVKLAYRQDMSQSFTTITDATHPTGAFTSADVGSGISGVIQVNFQKSQWLQIRCYLSSTATNPSYVRLRELRLR